MHLGGIGSENHSSFHHVTNCIHHHDAEKQVGAAGMRSAASSQMNAVPQEQRDPGFSLDMLLRKLLSGGRKLLGRFLGAHTQGEGLQDRPEAGSALQGGGSVESLALQEERRGEDSLLHNPQLSHAAAAVTPRQFVWNNPYFAAVSDTGNEKQRTWQKIKVRFQEITKHLTGQLSNKNSFHTGQQKPKQDLRRYSRYRKDDLEVECVITDDSYLLDSYNRKGSYSKLTVSGHNRE